MPVIDTAGYAKVPHWLMQHGPHAYLVYGALCAHAWQRDATSPSHRELSEQTSIGVTSVKRALALLADIGAIVTTEQRGPRGERLANLYDIRPALMHDPTTPSRDATSPSSPGDDQEQEQEQEDLLSGANAPDDATASPSIPDEPQPPAARTREADPDVTAICRAMQRHVTVLTGRAAPTITADWRSHARLMLDNDGVTLDVALRAIEWLSSPGRNAVFWSKNVLSVPTLRSRMPRLHLAAQEDRQQGRSTGPVDHVARAQQMIADRDAAGLT